MCSRLDASRLTDFYGAGALQLNYPNDFDRQEKRTGSGIWLHGVPRTNYAREPRATDGCVVLANEDLVALMRQVESGGAPVVIAPKIDWVKPSTLEPGRREAMAFLDTWHRARLASDADTLKSLYTQPSLAKAALAGSSNGRKSSRRERSQLAAAGPVASVLKDVSALHWRDGKELMVVTFGEVPEGATSGNTIRQYWSRESGRWKIFSETTLH